MLSKGPQTRFNAGMGTEVARRPGLGSLFLAFVSIGMMSFGGGLTAWIRREVVQRRGWLDDGQFLSSYGLSQIFPGATNVNLAIFIGTYLRGASGALAAVAGLTALPVAIVLALGTIYLRSRGRPGGEVLSAVLTGMGAVGIGLNLGTGIQLGWRRLRRVVPAVITTVVTISVGVLGFSLVHVLVVTLPVSIALASLESGR